MNVQPPPAQGQHRQPGPQGPRARGAGAAGRLRDLVDRLASGSPARLAIFSFLAVVVVFAVLLCLPISHQGPALDAGTGDGSALGDTAGRTAGWDPDLGHYLARSIFVAVSAVCVTGLSPVVTEDYWSPFGLGVITAAIQVGGLGILTLASVLGMAVSKRLGLRQRLIAAQATNTLQLGQVGTLLRTVVTTIISAEAVVFLLLFPRFLIRGDSFGMSVLHALFYSISSFNNAGFTVHRGGMEYFADDPWILSVIMASVFVGSLGFPVVLIMAVWWRRPRSWDLHTKLTLATSGLLVVFGVAFLYLFEYSNSQTLGHKGVGQTFMETLFMSVMPRSGGFSTFDINAMNPSSHLILDVLMFIGGGSSSTAGGIKVTTLAVLLLAAWSEARGLGDVVAFRRRIDRAAIRLAISVTLAGFVIVIGGTLALLQVTGQQLDQVLFEVISAFGTCGLSTGVTAASPPAGLYVLSVLMLVGRLGTITLAAAMSVRDTQRMFRYPEERPIIG